MEEIQIECHTVNVYYPFTVYQKRPETEIQTSQKAMKLVSSPLEAP